ncbi:OLC1v1019971C2 [Oldenlandia corymbosa var. corymbosa]|uniref:OLC1v1019971C2 n=1 Tax=Oldenlandia corymbosa var. corymbosa TaxID=529605 RepID=A0AAV1EFJ4_OLDCO|nr:OLC1v1019971C2 [Oldenlandia corymbosa var. corymbosa]
MEVGRDSNAVSGGRFLEGDLPEWFLFELLHRLPVKDVLRFQSVSKQWRSLISEHSFPDSYISRLPFSERRPFIFHPSKNQVIDGDDGIRSKYPEGHFLTLPTPKIKASKSRGPGYYFRTLGIDKGFLLVCWLVTVSGELSDYTIYSGGFHICSGTTHQRLSLPPLPPDSSFTKEGVCFIAQVNESRKVLTSFKVIVLDSIPLNGCFVVNIFSSETGRWELIRVPFQGPTTLILHSRRPVVLNNTIYWVTNERLNHGSSLGNVQSKILAYDPHVDPDHFRIIEFPIDYEHPNPPNASNEWLFFDSKCGVCQGRLKYFKKNEEKGREKTWLKVWELQDDGNSWCLQHTIKFDDVVDGDGRIQSPIRIWKVVSCHPSDPNVMYLDLGREMGMVSFNILTKKFEQVGPHIFFDDLFVVEIPPWPFSIPPSLMSVGDHE